MMMVLMMTIMIMIIKVIMIMKMVAIITISTMFYSYICIHLISFFINVIISNHLFRINSN